MDWHPLRFHPIYRERIWGGRSLASLYGRPLPGSRPIGESWEISDRPDAESIVSDGPLQGRSLRQLLAADPRGLLGNAPAPSGRFPLLLKILDARETLSLQVHPPPHLAARFGGEPKTELWYITHASDGARLLAGLRRGTTRAEFESRIHSGTVADCFHPIPVQPGDALFVPSGRVHALGAGVVLFEIQENSDTTFRVFDWNRPGLDGKPRALHIPESLACIDFTDFEPALADPAWQPVSPGVRQRLLARHPSFSTHVLRFEPAASLQLNLSRCALVAVTRGHLGITPAGRSQPCNLGPGDTALLPAALAQAELQARTQSGPSDPSHVECLLAEPGP